MVDIDVDDDGNWTASIKDSAETVTKTGREGSPVEVDFENQPITRLKIAKVDGSSISLDFLENAIFELYEKDGDSQTRVARFQIVENTDGTAGIHMLWTHPDREISGYTDKEFIEPESSNTGTNPFDDDSEEASDDSSGDNSSSADDQQGDQQNDQDGSEDTPDDPETTVDPETLKYAVLEGLTYNQEYVLKEIKAPKGYIKGEDITFTFEENPTSLIVKNYVPKIETVAKDSETGTHTACADDQVTIKDDITYKYLTPGKKYVMKGILYNRMKYLDDLDNPEYANEKEEPLLINGKKVVATKEFTAKDFTASAAERTETVTFPTFDATELAGKGIVVYEYCYEVNDDGEVSDTPVCEHAQPASEPQTIFFPEIRTNANDPETKTGLGTLEEEQTIVDTVTYKNLDPGVPYKMKATLFDKTTGELIRDKDGNTYTVEKEFTPEASDGAIDVTFTVDSRDLIGHMVVAFEECYVIGDPDVMVAFHKDPDDPKQNIEYPDPKYDMYKIRITDASKKKGTDKYGFKPGDKVLYEVHVVNQGNCPITLDVRDEFEANAKDYFTDPIVEKVDGATQNSISEDKNVVNITVEKGETAVVTYSSIILPGAEEYLAAAAKDSDSLDRAGKDTNRANQANKPDDKDGWVNTAYAENPTFPDPKDPKTPRPVPQGPKTDTAQTPVREPVIGTYLASKAGKKEIGSDTKTKLVDTVAYAGLTPGVRYSVVGELIVKDSGDPLVEHGKKVKAVGTFVPKDEKGTAKVEFTVDTTGLKGKELVAFETCYNVEGMTKSDAKSVATVEKEGIEVADHKDLDDEAQTVTVRRGNPSTGETPMTMPWIVFGICAAALAAIGIRKKVLKK